ncbi:diguanylate cyclase [Uliginosibacterium sp. H3]|uniref:Diguanylate cyclase n=1 Tax=Uliginosibacterium silvisoli TaxID=3114758 RepID=A0ABU6JYL7_9RHOO|nr:diguanylate cyclase [Uliginosibacterium sp. H3]
MSVSLPLRINLISLIFAALVASVLTALGGFFLHHQERDNAIARATLAADELATRASRLIAFDMGFADFLGFDEQCAAVIRNDPMLRDAALFDTHGAQQYHSGSGTIIWPEYAQLPEADDTQTVTTPSGILVLNPVVRGKGEVLGFAVVAINDAVVMEATLRNVGWLVACAAALFVAGLIIQQGIFWRAVGRPLASLVRTADSIQPDKLVEIPHLPDLDSNDDIGRLYRAFSRLVQRLLEARRDLLTQNEQLEHAVQERTTELERVNADLAHDIERRKELEEELRKLASTDPLTGLANRAFMMPYLERRIEQARRHRTPLGLILLDFDGFKHINDTYGHAVGDGVLQTMGLRLQQICRQSDVLARLGGDEFLISFEGLQEQYQADALCRRVVSLFATPIEIGDLKLQLGVSVGAALFPNNGDDLTSLMAAADIAMYAIKQRGGGFLFATSSAKIPAANDALAHSLRRPRSTDQ